MRPAKNSATRVLLASLIGTTIEFFDFYIYATAAVLVFPKLFFPSSDPTSATLQSLATFALAFFARPVGAALFGHFGDRIGRKATLVAALMTMGPSTVAIGLLPTYASIGIMAPILLALFRFGQGLGLGGEWGGAVLLATENAPPGKRAWYGMFPQLGAPIGFLLSTGTFLLLSNTLSDEQFFNFGWRIPFVASAILVFVGLYVRLKIEETPDFIDAMQKNERVKMPMHDVIFKNTRILFFGTIAATTTFVIFYLMTVFCLSWGTSVLHYSRSTFLLAQMVGVLFFAIGIPIAGLLADKYGRGNILIGATAIIFLFGLVFAPLFSTGSLFLTIVFLSIGLLLMGFTYGPLGAALAEVFPTAVRYTGASLTFTLAGILGASLAPYLATSLATQYGLEYVGYYLSTCALLSLLGFIKVRRLMQD
ncbi:MFS transporter [Polynucleobacter sphagniphilus]|jgi:metabolite-proton symporter|uniref:Metabolite-proton symporter n=1 Tax=Polynucleobacter sphagniphilus TaxID=1743169 RepID=A0AA43S5X4_9BURK|nr:MFS transporter [Polynucleobacter sphagniphilus]MDF9788842.1 metabolite-proton symporter [Polynucleobacter sphagniphilus]MDH6250024.1 metabolite-proton symporter [Polynucleobacter sphagniphilus]MDH6300309.1 metabolite-proton symporter [Polynucleobacter sphagniphilus]MDH6421960.1 metabolite-proton symporter [Polynucleobacter sphagniphilus]MDH6503862.1 metabolite-proton symporter [Polynucleobacter sphagniphilus]